MGTFFDLTGGAGHWRDEAGGLLRPAVEAFLDGQSLNAFQIAAMRAYLVQWIDAPGWAGHGIPELRARARRINTQMAIDAWLAEAEALGIDPL